MANLGYSLGFLVVVLGQQELFTENTLMPILPLLHQKSWRSRGNVLRLWGILLVTNSVGGAVSVLMVAHTGTFEPAMAFL